LFAAEGLTCTINLLWLDRSRQFEVRVSTSQDIYKFMLPIEGLAVMNEAEVINRYVIPAKAVILWRAA
jgi:hypothetical protein